jgi:hypothetical protein
VTSRMTSAAFLALLCWTGTVAAQEPPASVCEDDPRFELLDFWVGTWEVTDPAGNPQGSNTIEKVLAGCAILEHWTDAGGSQGKSLFYVDPASGVWKQVWVTQRALAAGGTKEKRFVERTEAGGVRFQGTITLEDGRSYLDRTTLTPLADGRVRQHIQTSMDGGDTWNAGWVGIYQRAPPS